ncbi:MAG: hypothetical protein ABEI96_02075 [Haloarculaceae archaeon]
MRTSRRVVRPLAALFVIVAATLLVANVAAYRAATTHQGSSCPRATTPDHDTDHDACARARTNATPRSREEAREAGEAGESNEDGEFGSSSGNVVVVTESGAS